MHQPKLFLLMGYPGAGKTTAAKAIQQLTRAVYLSSDELRAEMFPASTFSQTEHDQLYRELNDRLEEQLKAGNDVIYDANLNRFEHRKEKYEIATRIGAEPVLLWVQAARSLARERAAHISRKHLWPKHETPHEMFDRIADVIEPPKTDEPYHVIDGTVITPDYIKGILGL